MLITGKERVWQILSLNIPLLPHSLPIFSSSGGSYQAVSILAMVQRKYKRSRGDHVVPETKEAFEKQKDGIRSPRYGSRPERLPKGQN